MPQFHAHVRRNLRALRRNLRALRQVERPSSASIPGQRQDVLSGRVISERLRGQSRTDESLTVVKPPAWQMVGGIFALGSSFLYTLWCAKNFDIQTIPDWHKVSGEHIDFTAHLEKGQIACEPEPPCRSV